jgi:hypothetical protein
MYNEKRHYHFQEWDGIELHHLNMVEINMDQVSKDIFKSKVCLWEGGRHTISQFCPPKLSKQSHLYVPGRLIQVRAALQG